MVDNREVLKSTVETDLRKKIECAQKILGELRDAIQQIEENSTKAKGEVNQAVECIQQLVGKRQIQLSKQIDTICHKQISGLHDEIQSMYLALGSLQSTLSNLDSFDHSQLLNLHIPNVSTSSNSVPPSQLEIKVNNSTLDKDIKEWGAVSSKGFKGLFDVGTSASLPPRFVEYHDGKNGQEFMSHKPVACGTSSVINFLRQPKLPCISNQNVESVPDEIVSGFEVCDIEQWLSGVKIQPSENDDFEIVSIEDSSSTKRKDSMNIPEQEFISCCQSEESNGSSSIVCWQNEDATNDISKWLKPKKSCKENMDPTTSKQFTKAYIHNPQKNRFVDFPCLRTDLKTWVSPAKRAKLSNVSAELGFSTEIFPPEYSLPAPFWLKRHC